jgi:hypothetical protein
VAIAAKLFVDYPMKIKKMDVGKNKKTGAINRQ